VGGGPRWSHAEDRTADAKWGEEALATTAGRVERSVDAVRSRYRTRGLNGRATNGRVTIHHVAERTGYHWHDVARAISELGLKPIRTGAVPRGRRNLLSSEQVAKVLEHLGQETAADAARWAPVEEVARLAGVCRRTVYYAVAGLGRYVTVDYGRVPRCQLPQLLAVLRLRWPGVLRY
jgi:hypothetical protein